MHPNILRFPIDGSIGELSSRPLGSTGDWVEFSHAVGDVVLPVGEEIKLWIDANARFGPSILSAIPPGALTELEWVSNWAVTDAGIEPIGRLKGLKGLALWETPIGDEGIAHLHGLAGLLWLDIGETAIANEGLRHLQTLSSLRALSLLGTRIDDGWRYLPALERLERLDQMETLVGDAGVIELSLMTSLKSLRVYQTRITTAGYSSLVRALPRCEIKFLDPHVPEPSTKDPL